jgi:type I restriction enzyme, R subunit
VPSNKPAAYFVREVSAGYGELQLVEAPAIELLKSLGWQHADLFK